MYQWYLHWYHWKEECLLFHFIIINNPFHNYPGFVLQAKSAIFAAKCPAWAYFTLTRCRVFFFTLTRRRVFFPLLPTGRRLRGPSSKTLPSLCCSECIHPPVRLAPSSKMIWNMFRTSLRTFLFTSAYSELSRTLDAVLDFFYWFFFSTSVSFKRQTAFFIFFISHLL